MLQNANLLRHPRCQKLSQLLGIEWPLIQGGMVWVSGGKLAAAVSQAGGLGVLGAGSMSPERLETQIRKAQALTSRPLAVNVPLLYRGAQAQVDTALANGIRIFFTSAGSPKVHTPRLKANGCLVVHVSSTIDEAQKCVDAGVDAVVLEGFEAGGHNGRHELTSLVLLQQAKKFLGATVPLIAAGGFASGASVLAAIVLGASGVQFGTLFAAATESSAHERFKQALMDAPRHATFLRLKKLVPVRLLNNAFSAQIAELEAQGASAEVLQNTLGKGRAKRGIFEGDIQEGELEIGQIVSQIDAIENAEVILSRIVTECAQASGDLLQCLSAGWVAR